MNTNKDNLFGQYLKNLFEEHDITSSRQGRIRTGISHTTLEEILRGRQPSVESTIRIAKAFHKDVAEALRLAGHSDIGEAWENRGEEVVGRTDGVDRKELTYERDDIQELLSAYTGTPEPLQPVALAAIKAVRDAAIKERDRGVIGRRIEDED